MTPHCVVNEKPIYVFENHADAIIPWGIFRQTQCQPAVLVSLDEHTDTLPAFFRYGHSDYEAHRDRDRWEESKVRRLSEVRFEDTDSLRKAADDLWHDEHICAACESGIFSHAFIVARRSPGETQQRSFLTYCPDLCYVGCGQSCHNQECLVRHSDLAVHDVHLDPLLTECEGFTDTFESGVPLILDIDLDYFRTWKSLEPEQSLFFNQLVARASIITIATEPGCTKDLWLDEDTRWTQNLERLLDLIKKAGAAPKK